MSTRPLIKRVSGSPKADDINSSLRDAENKLAEIHALLDSIKVATTAGDTIYYDGTDYKRLAIGTASQVLKVNSGATAPEWAAGVSTPVSVANGGTGQTTATAAFDALAPTTTQGDVIYHNGTDNVRLAKGTAYQQLRMNSGATAPEWGGAWVDVAFDAGLYADTGAGTWTVQSADHLLYRYRETGPVIEVQVSLNDTAISGTVTELLFDIPNGRTAAQACTGACFALSSGATIARCNSGDTQIRVIRADGSAFPSPTSALDVAFDIRIPI